MRREMRLEPHVLPRKGSEHPGAMMRYYVGGSFSIHFPAASLFQVVIDKYFAFGDQ